MYMFVYVCFIWCLIGKVDNNKFNNQFSNLALQWNLCIMDILGPTKGVQIIKVS